MAAITINFSTFHFPRFHFPTFDFSKSYSSTFLRSDGNDTRCSQQRADCAVHMSTSIRKGARSEIAVDSDNCFHLNQITTLFVCYYYFIILLVIFNTYKVYL